MARGLTGKVRPKAEPLKRPLREIGRPQLTEHIQRLWDHYNIPEFHRQLYLKRFGADDYSLDVLHKEVGALAKGIAPVQRALRAIAHREEILLRLGVLRGAFADAEFSVPGSLARCELSEQFYSLRMATVEAILALVAWRHSVAPRAGPTCIAGPGTRGASWPFTSVNGESWPDYFMHIASNDAAVRRFQNVAELSKDYDPLLVHASVGGVGPFQGGKLCPPCCDAMHRQSLDRARCLVEEELASALFHPLRAGTPQDKASSWRTPSPELRTEEDFPSRPSSRLLQELAGPPVLPPLKDAPTPSVTPPPAPAPPTRPRSGPRRRKPPIIKEPEEIADRPASATGSPSSRRKVRSRRLSMSGLKVGGRRGALKESIPLWRIEPRLPDMSPGLGLDSAEGSCATPPDEEVDKELRELIALSTSTKRRSLTDGAGVPKLLKAQTAGAETAESPRYEAPASSRSTNPGKEPLKDSQVSAQTPPSSASDEEAEEEALTLKCGVDMARLQSVWNRFEHDNVIHHDDVCMALQRIGFVGPDKEWVEEAFEKVTMFNGVSREEFMQIVDYYDEKQRVHFREKFISCDADGSGQMDIDEFAEFLRGIGTEPMRHALEECIAEMDEDGSGQLDFDEFYKVMTLMAQREGFSRSEVIGFEAVFQKFDTYSNDEIDVKELQQVLMFVGIPITEEECREVGEEIDLDGSGYIDFQEFLMCMRLFRVSELADWKGNLQEISEGNEESIPSSQLSKLLQKSGYFTEQAVVNEVLCEIGLDPAADTQIDLGTLWKFLVVFRAREGLSSAEIARVREAFRAKASGDDEDEDDAREIATDQMPQVLRVIGYSLALEDQKQLTAQVDVDRSGALNLGELLKLVRFVKERRSKEIQAVFAKVDPYETGVISEREVMKALVQLGCIRDADTVVPLGVAEESVNGYLGHSGFLRTVQKFDDLQRQQLIKSGGYTAEQMEALSRQFRCYDWDGSGEISQKELVALIVDVFPDLAFNPDQRPLLVQIVEGADKDRNGKLNFDEFLHLMRTVEDLGHLTQLKKERSVIEDTYFNTNEVSEFRSIFLARTKGQPRMSLSDFKELVSPVCPMGDKNSHEISGMWRETCGEVTKLCDFPDFLLLMRKMMDKDFFPIMKAKQRSRMSRRVLTHSQTTMSRMAS